jgi:two-component system phosphate regulon sensor histidine kinase PhoR
MFNSKNQSPAKLSFFTAIALATPIGITFYYFERKVLVALIIFIAIFLLSYFLFKYVLEVFIYRKLKLIYKFIFQTKASKREETYYKYILPKKSIDEVREDVEEWAEQKKVEIENLQQNEIFRKEFLQNLAHEFKTPVFAIQGYIESLIDGVDDKDLQKKFLRKTNVNIERLTNLLNDLDEITSLETRVQPLKKTSFIIQDVIKEVFEELSFKSSKTNIYCSIKKGCESSIWVKADVNKIKQVLHNLIENAIKYGKENGTISAGIYITDDKYVLIEISDDGIGIAEEHLPRVFERFYRTDLGRSRDAGGSGLGLAICKHIIEAHGNTLHIRSKPDVGTTIGFTLHKV